MILDTLEPYIHSDIWNGTSTIFWFVLGLYGVALRVYYKLKKNYALAAWGRLLKMLL